MEETYQEKVLAQIGKLEEKYEASGQDMLSYLEGLYHSDFLTYWDYIHLDTLLTLQKPRTPIPDEKIFIIYHQITELYLQLIILELEQALPTTVEEISANNLLVRIQRVGRYMEALTNSFHIMSKGMAPEQFLKFRMALLPASGFQSGQFRKIEIAFTALTNLCEGDVSGLTNKEKLQKIYWLRGASELSSGKQTLTLRKFFEKYGAAFEEYANKWEGFTIGEQLNLLQAKGLLPTDLQEEARKLDYLFNVVWKLAHLGAAATYLQKEPKDIEATGGTNWQKYLPPRFQKIIFFPTLWSETEKEEWGRPRAFEQRA